MAVCSRCYLAGLKQRPCTRQASAFIMFPDIYSSCRGASILRDHTAVDAVEMFDRASLRCAAAWLCRWITLNLKNPKTCGFVGGASSASWHL